MSSQPTGNRAGLSPWWALLLLAPLPFVAGWFIADLPSSSHAVANASSSPSAGSEGSAASMGPASSAPTVATDDLAWTGLDDAMQTAARDHKAVLIDFNAAWCGPCQMLRHSVFEDDAIARQLGPHVVGVSIVDRVREDGQNPPETEQLQQRYGIRAFPTLVLIPASGGHAEKLEGFYGPSATRDWIVRTADRMR